MENLIFSLVTVSISMIISLPIIIYMENISNLNRRLKKVEKKIGKK